MKKEFPFFEESVGLLIDKIDSKTFCEKENVYIVRTKEKEYIVLKFPAKRNILHIDMHHPKHLNKFIKKSEILALNKPIQCFYRRESIEWIDIESITTFLEVTEFPSFMKKSEEEAVEERREAIDKIENLIEEAREKYRQAEEKLDSSLIEKLYKLLWRGK